MSSIGAPDANISLQFIQSSQANTAEQVQEDLSTAVVQTQNAMQNDARVMDTEIMGISKNMVKLEKKLASEDHRAVMNQGKDGQVPEMIEAILAILTADNLNKKKRKKKTSFEEKMEDLENLEGLIDIKQLDAPDQQTFEKMLTNMTTIKRLKAKLKQVEAQEEFMEEQVRKQFPEAKGELPADFEDEDTEEPTLEIKG